MSLSLFIAQRLNYYKKAEKKVSRPAVLISVLGIAIGLAVMIVSVAIVVGFKSEIRNKMVGFASHIQITNLDRLESYETNPIVASDSLLTLLRNNSRIKHVECYSTKMGMIKTDNAFEGVALKGVGANYDSSFLKEHLLEGALPQFSDTLSSNQVLISKTLALKLQLKLNDKFFIYFMQENLRVRRLKIVGIYQTNFSEYDNVFLFTDMAMVRQLNGWHKNQVSGIELTLNDYSQLDEVTDELSQQIDSHEDCYGGVYYVRNIIQQNPQIFSWLNLLDLNVWAILILMLGVAGFSMISGLLIIILERTNMIGVLKALGASNFIIRKTFLWLSVFIIGKGMIWGNIVGVLICVVQRYFHLITLDPTVYYVNTAPIHLTWYHWLLINVGTFVVSVLMLVGPSFLITRINPATSIRYE